VPDLDIEQFHMEQLLSCLSIPDATYEKSESPDYLIGNNEVTIGIELTRFYPSPVKGDKPEQELEALTNLAVETAHKKYIKNGGDAIYIDFHISRNGPKNKKQAYDLGNRIAAEILTHGWQQLKFDAISEVEDCTVRSSLDGVDDLWQGGCGGFVQNASMEDIQIIIDKKSQKVPNYREKCSQVWLILVHDVFRGGAGYALNTQSTDEIFVREFDRVLWLRAHVPSITEFGVENVS